MKRVNGERGTDVFTAATSGQHDVGFGRRRFYFPLRNADTKGCVRG